MSEADSQDVQVMVNGQMVVVAPGGTVADLLVLLGLVGQPAAVEINKKLVPKRLHALTVLVANDKIEIVTLVGGG